MEYKYRPSDHPRSTLRSQSSPYTNLQTSKPPNLQTFNPPNLPPSKSLNLQTFKPYYNTNFQTFQLFANMLYTKFLLAAMVGACSCAPAGLAPGKYTYRISSLLTDSNKVSSRETASFTRRMTSFHLTIAERLSRRITAGKVSRPTIAERLSRLITAGKVSRPTTAGRLSRLTIAGMWQRSNLWDWT